MDLQEIKRKYFRISVKENEDISMKINDASYEVVNVGDHGIGIRLTSEDIFFAVDDELPIELKIMGETHNLQGKVVHISLSGPEEYLCGIDLINLDDRTKEKLMGYLESSREKIFRGE
jgi:hypothetical protein